MMDNNNSFTRGVTSGNFLAGLAVGALATYVLTNPTVQAALLRTVARTTGLIKSSFAEARERFHDAEAEIEIEAGEESEAD